MQWLREIAKCSEASERGVHHGWSARTPEIAALNCMAILAEERTKNMLHCREAWRPVRLRALEPAGSWWGAWLQGRALQARSPFWTCLQLSARSRYDAPALKHISSLRADPSQNYPRVGRLVEQQHDTVLGRDKFQSWLRSPSLAGRPGQR